MGYARRASAAAFGGIGGKPAYPREDNPRTESIFVHTLNPGDARGEGVWVLNQTDARKTVRVYAVDSAPSTGGAFACAQNSQMKNTVGAWIALEKSEVTLDSGMSELVPFSIAVPLAASAGEYNGCIILEEVREQSSNAQGISVAMRTGLRVALTVPGSIERTLALTDFTVTPKGEEGYVLRLNVRNPTTVSIDADMRIETRYFFGLVLAEQVGQIPVLRNDSTELSFELKKPFWGGWYRARAEVRYDPHPEAGVGVKSGKTLTSLGSTTVWFFSPPTFAAYVTAVLLLILCAGGWYYLRGRMRARKSTY